MSYAENKSRCERCGCETHYMTAMGICEGCRHEEEVKKYNEEFAQRQREREERERRERENNGR